MRPRKKALHYLCDVSVINNIGSGFSADFMEQLKNPLKEIGYCLTVLADVLTDSSKINDLVMNVSLFILIPILLQSADRTSEY